MTGKVCLIIPPSPFLLDERVFMPLGVLKVAAALEAHGYAVDLLDLSGVKNYREVIAEYITSGATSTYGITATTPQMPAATLIAADIRGYGQYDHRIILGGPHVTLVNAAAKRRCQRADQPLNDLLTHFDLLIAGDGERAILPALHSPTAGLIDADDRHSKYFLHDQDLDSQPLPARHLIDVGSYHYNIDGLPALSLIAQLGCPFGCGFCAGRHSPSLRHIRTRSVDSIIEEMTHLYFRYGTRGFMFYDDELNVNLELVQLMRNITYVQQQLGVEWRLRGFIKAELFTDEQAQAMRAAGFRWLLVGFESGSDRILDNINKKATKDDNTRAIEIARRHDLKVKALMSLGHPGESPETLAETMAWLRAVKPEDFDLTIITPYPGSPYYDDAVKHGANWVYSCKNGDRLYQREVEYTREADYYKGDPNDGYISHVWTDYVSSEALVAVRNAMECELRADLGIPFYPSVAARSYEHSMGQTQLPDWIKKSSQPSVFFDNIGPS